MKPIFTQNVYHFWVDRGFTIESSLVAKRYAIMKAVIGKKIFITIIQDILRITGGTRINFKNL